MARGFESKSVQEQWQDAEARRDQLKKPRVTREEMERERQRADLLATRGRLDRELAAATSDLRRIPLQAALDHVQAQLRELDEPST
ncbi:MAG TPA: hypothetical protein VFL80_09870 [Thermoanaerobaculia bacterium]|nr:hypothetical protein [Thermoanaerobaculia bacterium]